MIDRSRADQRVKYAVEPRSRATGGSGRGSRSWTLPPQMSNPEWQRAIAVTVAEGDVSSTTGEVPASTTWSAAEDDHPAMLGLNRKNDRRVRRPPVGPGFLPTSPPSWLRPSTRATRPRGGRWRARDFSERRTGEIIPEDPSDEVQLQLCAAPSPPGELTGVAGGVTERRPDAQRRRARYKPRAHAEGDRPFDRGHSQPLSACGCGAKTS